MARAWRRLLWEPATVDASGLVTAVDDGECVITGTVANTNPAITDTCAVTAETP